MNPIVPALAAAALTGCLPAKPSTSVAGPIPVVITNNYHEPMCTLAIYPNTDVMAHKHMLEFANPLDAQHKPPVEPGQTVRTSLMAGSYTIDAATCGNRVVSDQYFGYHDIKGPTAIGLDGPEQSAPADYDHWQVRMKDAGPTGPDEQPSGSCLPAGASIGDNPDDSRCCSHRMSFPNGDSRRAECS